MREIYTHPQLTYRFRWFSHAARLRQEHGIFYYVEGHVEATDYEAALRQLEDQYEFNRNPQIMQER